MAASRLHLAVRLGGALLLVLAVAAISPVVWVEARCVAPREPVGGAHQPILAPEHRRNPVDTWLTYPEWSIVHAYEDFAAVARARGESSFGYRTSIAGYWRGLCATMRVASARGEVSPDVRTMLHVIGTSFAAEMLVKGAWESTVGAATEALRGAGTTPEDDFAHAVADDYAAFLRQTPWYAYPFGPTLVRLWSEVPFGRGAPVRAAERRIALTLEWSVKAAYAKALGALAGLSPAAATIRSVVRGIDGTDPVADPRIVLVERRADGTAIVETPRYRAFTEVVAGLAARGRDLVEIAGNDTVLVTVVAPRAAPSPAGTVPRLAVPVQARPGTERRALDVRVDALAATLRAMGDGPVRLEHVYDY